jgi:two-component system, chemotaxis family, chemotaxis protein CheY
MKVLIVDDSSFARQFIKKVITEHLQDIEFCFAASGEEGFDMFLAENPDFVITDLLMPGIGGQAMIGLIREKAPACRIIVVSSDVQRAVKAEISELGVLRFINKPLNDENKTELIRILQEA